MKSVYNKNQTIFNINSDLNWKLQNKCNENELKGWMQCFLQHLIIISDDSTGAHLNLMQVWYNPPDAFKHEF